MHAQIGSEGVAAVAGVDSSDRSHRDVGAETATKQLQTNNSIGSFR